MEEQKLLIIDGFNLLSRGYFATAYHQSEDQLPKNDQGLYTNALRVFFQKLFNLIHTHQTSHVTIAWDVKREETNRRQKYDFYKSSRQALPEPLIQQYETLTFALTDLGIEQLTIPPYEADDVIGSLSNKWADVMQSPCFIYSNDRDLLQLLNPHVSQIIAKNKKEHVYSQSDFEADYQITPDQWIDVKALLGDKGDNIPGVKGIGEKSALPLVQRYQTVEKLYQALPELDATFNRSIKRLTEGKKDAFMSKELVTIDQKIPYFDQFDLNRLNYVPKQEYITTILSDLGINVRLYAF
ncbi:5'-3' exonuclease [Pelagirhabdus alkalitolerans]|uniref:5'-3' exonuclease n=1 Tax=Pelagirhabdus alkalitolerans TaxID=1612202 RepID=A0A1G6KHU2_9BACI|nr:5'-3' exonuclease [Pelagirhabdus alkalitolerans]SDC30135.1 5'-3' exonuclease [Pelagirhabdus alkalitolerans]